MVLFTIGWMDYSQLVRRMSMEEIQNLYDAVRSGSGLLVILDWLLVVQRLQ